MRLLLLALLILANSMSYAQDNDPVLFTVADDEIRLSEFKYIYEKNNSENADYSKESLEEYMELYSKFKLKVKRARSLGLDTVKVLKEELAGYRKQLAKSYLKDKEISERLINEVMERMMTDVEVQHIFVAAELKSSEAKKNSAKEKIYNMYDKLVTTNGAGFDEMAKTLSEDKQSSVKSGKLGYYTSPLPDGFYEFENAMYELEPGQFSKPIRSKMGWHIIKVNHKRDARGEMEIGHILIRKKNRSAEEALSMIDSVAGLIEIGRNFETLAAKFSEDIKSKHNGGYIGYFAINQYEPSFEDAAFGLTEDGSYSEPVESSLGFHIIKRISKRDVSDKDRLRKRIQARINNNDRFEIAEMKMIEDVKTEAGFNEDPLMLKRFSTALDGGFYSYKWQTPSYDEGMVLFELDGKEYDLNAFADYCKSNVRERLKFNKSKNPAEAAEEMYATYVKDIAMKYEEANLENKYSDFRSLMREYSEGILLFEITKQEVWDKASQDSLGLKEFFNSIQDKYQWPERVAVYKYTIDSDHVGAVTAYSYAQKKSHSKLVEKYSDDEEINLSFEELVLDKSSELLEGLELKENAVSKLLTRPAPANFIAFKEMVAPKAKTLEEAKGYVIADYQDHLEKEWVSKLSEMYPVKVNKKVLNSITKK